MSSLNNPRERLVQISRLFASGDYEQAQELLERVIEESPENADAWYLAAVISRSSTAKVENLNRALELDPNHRRAQELLAKISPTSRSDTSTSSDQGVLQNTSNNNRFLRFGVILVVALILVVIVLVFESRFAQAPTITPTTPTVATSLSPVPSRTGGLNPSEVIPSETAIVLPSKTLVPTTLKPSNTPTRTKTATATLTLTPSATFPPVSAPPPLTVAPPPVSATPAQPLGPIQETPVITLPPPPITPE